MGTAEEVESRGLIERWKLDRAVVKLSGEVGWRVG